MVPGKQHQADDADVSHKIWLVVDLPLQKILVNLDDFPIYNRHILKIFKDIKSSKAPTRDWLNQLLHMSLAAVMFPSGVTSLRDGSNPRKTMGKPWEHHGKMVV